MDPERQELNLLIDPLLPVATDGQLEQLSLAGLLARLLVSEVPHIGFPGLAAEQRSHWYRFLVRCGAKALHSVGTTPEALRSASVDVIAGDLSGTLTEASNGSKAWDLFQPDLGLPGFLQSPVVGGAKLEDANYRERPISMLTCLLGEKNFERKHDAVRTLTPAEVTYALLEYQGGVIFGGRLNYQTQLTPSRSGKGSGVPFMALSLAEGFSASLRRDIGLLLNRWDAIRLESGLDGCVWALWTLPWNGTDALHGHELEPAFIPMARMVRVAAPTPTVGFERVYFRPSDANRVLDHTGGARFGDLFTPYTPNPKHPDQLKVRGTMEYGYTYPEVADLLGFGNRGRQPSETVRAFFAGSASDQVTDVKVLFEGVAFEQGKTLGFHRREVLLPISQVGGSTFEDPEPLRAAHLFMLTKIQEAKTILRSAARIVLSGNPKPRRGDEERVNVASGLLDTFAEENDMYLRTLFEAGAMERSNDRSYQASWLEWVADRARRAFRRALPRLPSPGAQRLEREMNAENYLEGRLWHLQGKGQETSLEEEKEVVQ